MVLESFKSEVQTALERTSLKIHLDIVGIPIGEDWGTADSLRHLEESNRIKVGYSLTQILRVVSLGSHIRDVVVIWMLPFIEENWSY